MLMIPGAVVVAQSTPTPAVAPMPRVIAEVSAGSNSTVKGAPFSAEGVSESVQTLSDGNRIVRRWNEKLYRSSEGKFRRDGSGSPGSAFGSFVVGNSDITVIDPVGGFRYFFNTDSKIVRESQYRVAPIILSGQGQTLFNGTIQADKAAVAAAQKAVVELKAAQVAGGGVDITPSGNDSDVKVYRTGYLQVAAAKLATLATTMPAIPAMPAMPVISGSTNGQKWETHTEQLGTQNFEGVDAEGTRTVTTIPADAIGNERPIEIVYERWYSKELQMIVYSKHSDPRFGEQTYRLTNINRSEPDPSLFEKPAGYKVVSDARPTTYRLAPTRKVTTVPVKNVATTTVTKP